LTIGGEVQGQKVVTRVTKRAVSARGCSGGRRVSTTLKTVKLREKERKHWRSRVGNFFACAAHWDSAGQGVWQRSCRSQDDEDGKPNREKITRNLSKVGTKVVV